MNVVSLSDFTKELRNVIEKGLKEKADSLNALVDETADKLCEEIRDGSKEWSKYSKSWTVTESKNSTGFKQDGSGVKMKIVHNKRKYRLTHLIESGTVGRYTEAGTYRGEMPKKPHIRPAADKAQAEFIQKLKQI